MNEEEIRQALSAMMESLENVNSARSQVQMVSQSFERLAQSLAAFEDSVRVDTQNIGQSAQMISGSSEVIMQMRSIVENLQANIVTINRSVTRLEAPLTRLVQSVGGVSTSVTNLENRINGLGIDLSNQITRDVNELRTHIDSTSETLSLVVKSQSNDILTRASQVRDQVDRGTRRTIDSLARNEQMVMREVDGIKKVIIASVCIIVVLIVFVLIKL